MLNTTNKYGKIYIKNETIKVIVTQAASEVYGVWTFSRSHNKFGDWQLRRLLRGTKIKYQNNSLNIEVDVVLKVGVNVNAVRNSVESEIRFAIEQYVGLPVSAINVNVVGFRL